MISKVTSTLTVLCAAVGVPWAVLIWLSGAMKSVPGLDGHDLLMSLPLPSAAIGCGAISVVLALTTNPKKKKLAWVAGIAAGVSLLIIGILVWTYYDMQQERFL